MNCRIKTQINNEHIVRTVLNKSDDKYVTFDTAVGCVRQDFMSSDEVTFYPAKAGINHLNMCRRVINSIRPIASPSLSTTTETIRKPVFGVTGPTGFMGLRNAPEQAVIGVTGPSSPQAPMGATGCVADYSTEFKTKQAFNLSKRLSYFRKRERMYND